MLRFIGERVKRDTYRGVQMEIVDYGLYVCQGGVDVSTNVLRSVGVNQNDAMTHCHMYAHGFK